MFVHVVERREDGIVICGAKAHQTGSINSHWHIFMPTFAMGEADKDYAVSFACPTDTEGLYMTYGRQSCDTRKMEDGCIDVGNAKFGGQEALVVLDHVFIPNEYIFLNGEYEFAGIMVERFAGYHRQSYGGCKVGVGDVVIGAAALAAEYNGVEKASHIKDKLIEMTHLNETLYSCGIACSCEGCPTKAGNYQIDLLLANVCKQNVTRFPYEIVRLAEDIAGGLMVTMPSEKDFLSDTVVGREGETHYTPNAGMTVLRQAVAEKYQKTYWDGYTADHVMVTVGAMEGLMLTMMLLLDPGDEILVPDPCFPNYYGQASLTGAQAKPVPTYEENDYRMMAADIEKCITPHTKALLLNSPCNPTGAVLTKEDILAIAEVVKKHDLWVLSDEPYDSIVYGGVEPFSMAQVPEVRDRVFVLNSFSKSYAMTGWRVGYVVAPSAACVKKMAQMNEAIASCVSSFSQVAAAEALKSTECVEQMVADYTRRRDILIDGINAIPGFSCRKSAGSFYAFANIKAFGKSSQEFAEELLTDAGVVTVPGSAFGACGEGYLRLVFANSDENLKEAVRRIDTYVRKTYPDMK